MLMAFFAILLIIFITMMAGGILGYIFRSEVDERMHTEMVESVTSYRKDKKVTDAWDAVQRNVSHYLAYCLQQSQNSYHSHINSYNVAVFYLSPIPSHSSNIKDVNRMKYGSKKVILKNKIYLNHAASRDRLFHPSYLVQFNKIQIEKHYKNHVHPSQPSIKM